MKKLDILLVPVVITLLSSCGENNHTADPVEPNPTELTISTSLHGTAAGMEYFYSDDHGGFETVSEIPFDDLSCKNCHVEPTQCIVCHTNAGTRPENRFCTESCHFRQADEIARHGDVHLSEENFDCATCHKSAQVHGDGTSYHSMLTASNAVSCEQSGCHENVLDEEHNASHTRHGQDFDCQACHSKSVLTYFDTDFASAVRGETDAFYGTEPIDDWRFLVRDTRSGKITTANIRVLTHEGKAFYSVAPHHSHTIFEPDGTDCFSCHSSAALAEYKADGIMTLTSWDDGGSSLSHAAEVIPIPEDWQTALKLDFITRDADGNAVFVSDSADAVQMLFAEPIDVVRMPKF